MRLRRRVVQVKQLLLESVEAEVAPVGAAGVRLQAPGVPTARPAESPAVEAVWDRVPRRMVQRLISVKAANDRDPI